jgi:hypothetical protein
MGLADPDGWCLIVVEIEERSVAAPSARAYDRARARLTLTRRQIPASLPPHARTRASAALPVLRIQAVR